MNGAESDDAAPARWRLLRNCAMTPACFAACCAGAGGGSLLVGLGFWWLGYPGVAAFAGLELLLLVVCAVWYARHAADGEEVELLPALLQVRHWNAGACVLQHFRTAFVQVHVDPRTRLVVCREGRRCAVVGEHASAATRQGFARELRAALAAARSPSRAAPGIHTLAQRPTHPAGDHA